jgi:maltoporin
MRYGKDNEDLVRFWAFLLLGRRFAKRIDVLFPDGYFHGVIAPDAGAEQSGVGYFSIVRVLNDRKLSSKIRTPRFPPFDSLELVSSLDGLKL